MSEENPERGEKDAAATPPRPVNGWTIVHSKREKLCNDKFEGVWLGVRGDAWMAGRQYTGKSMDDGFIDGEWWYSHYSEFGENSTANMTAALEAYIAMAERAGLRDRMLAQDAGQAIDRYLAGPEVPGAAKFTAHWKRSDPGPSVPIGARTEPMPLHEAKYALLHFLRTTELNALAHLTVGVTIDRHEAIELVRAAKRPICFEHGYNTYWLAEEGTN